MVYPKTSVAARQFLVCREGARLVIRMTILGMSNTCQSVICPAVQHVGNRYAGLLTTCSASA